MRKIFVTILLLLAFNSRAQLVHHDVILDADYINVLDTVVLANMPAIDRLYLSYGVTGYRWKQYHTEGDSVRFLINRGVWVMPPVVDSFFAVSDSLNLKIEY